MNTAPVLAVGAMQILGAGLVFLTLYIALCALWRSRKQQKDGIYSDTFPFLHFACI